jgi:hypothetical protein
MVDDATVISAFVSQYSPTSGSARADEAKADLDAAGSSFTPRCTRLQCFGVAANARAVAQFNRAWR